MKEQERATLIRSLLNSGISQELIDQTKNDFQLQAIRSYVGLAQDTDIEFKDFSYVRNSGGLKRFRHILIREISREYFRARGVSENDLKKLSNPNALKALAHLLKNDPNTVIDVDTLKAIRNDAKLKQFLKENTPEDFKDKLSNLGVQESDIQQLDNLDRHAKKAFEIFATYKRNEAPDFDALKQVNNDAKLDAFELAKRSGIDTAQANTFIESGSVNATKLQEFLHGITESQMNEVIQNNPAISDELKRFFNYTYKDFSDATSVSLVTKLSNYESIAHYISQKVASDLGLQSSDFTKGIFIAEIVKLMAQRDGINPEDLTEPEDAILKALLSDNPIDTSAILGITDITDKVQMTEREVSMFMNPFFEEQILDSLDETPTSKEFYEALNKEILTEIFTEADINPV